MTNDVSLSRLPKIEKSKRKWFYLQLFECICSGLRTVREELSASVRFVRLVDRLRCPRERIQTTQEAPVLLVFPRDGSVTLPTVAPQRIEAAVVAGAGECVRLDRAALRPSVVGKNRPRETRGWVIRRDLGGRNSGGDFRQGFGIIRKQCGWWSAEQILVKSHGPTLCGQHIRVDRLPARTGREWVAQLLVDQHPDDQPDDGAKDRKWGNRRTRASDKQRTE